MIKRCVLNDKEMRVISNYFLSFFFLIVNATEAERKSFIEELNVMKCLPPHDNVISLLGCVTKSGNSFFLQH